MKATHLLHALWPVAVEPRDDSTVWVTYVGPDVPANRALGERRMASRTDLFTGKPTLTEIEHAPQEK